jgi:hypothetical protein
MTRPLSYRAAAPGISQLGMTRLRKKLAIVDPNIMPSWSPIGTRRGGSKFALRQGPLFPGEQPSCSRHFDR